MVSAHQIAVALKTLITAAHENQVPLANVEALAREAAPVAAAESNPFDEATGITDEAKAAKPQAPVVTDERRAELFAAVDKATANIGHAGQILGAAVQAIGEVSSFLKFL